MISKEEAKTEIIALWHLRPPEEKSGVHGLGFFLWLEKNRPDLLDFECRGDRYQYVMAWITEHLTSP
jgi:hypothetical protein